MGTQSGSGSVVTSGPSSFFESSNYSGSNCSVKSRAGTSSSTSSNHYEEQEKELYDERKNLLNASISRVRIGIEPIGTKAGHLISNGISKAGIKNFLPTYLGGSTFTYHASVFLDLDTLEPSEGVILEYGGYSGGDASYKNKNIHYAEEDGLRFIKISYEDYKKRIHNGLKGSQIIEHLDKTCFLYTLSKLIDECTSNCKKKWRKKDYNLSSHNCQDFVAQVIEILEVRRKEFDEPSYGRHNYSLSIYPPAIVKALEKSEKKI